MKQQYDVLAREYHSAIQNYLANADEACLADVYEMGRRAITEKIGLTPLVSIHQEALLEARCPLGSCPGTLSIERAKALLLETLSPFEMVLAANERLWDLQRDLARAARVQCSLLPEGTGHDSEGTTFEIHAEMRPARLVGGDFYDFFALGGDRVGFLLADVAGKGICAAVAMGMACTALRTAAAEKTDPSACLRAVNKVLCSRALPEMCMTVFYGILDLTTGRLEFCSGGHPAPYCCASSGKVTRLPDVGGLLLGAFADAEYETGKTQLQPKESLVIYSDGVAEAEDEHGLQYTSGRLQATLEGLAHLPSLELVREVIDDVYGFSARTPLDDDLCVLALRYLGDSQEEAARKMNLVDLELVV